MLIRLAVAAGALVVGWVAGSFLYLLYYLAASGGIAVDYRDALYVVLWIGVFSGVTWALAVIPLVFVGDHSSRFFDPRRAPLVGAVCGFLALVVLFSGFFAIPPWTVLRGSEDLEYYVFFPVAAVVGAALWTFYTRAVRRRTAEVRSEEDSD
jgi:ABC-type dipeptide/oligopeptide/nickel transport system permease subunit